MRHQHGPRREPSVVFLYFGGGGCDLAFLRSGFSTKWANDCPSASAMYKDNIVGIRSDCYMEYKFPYATGGPHRTKRYVSQRAAMGGLDQSAEGPYCPELFHWHYLSRNRRRTWGKRAQCIVDHWRGVLLQPASPPFRKIGRDRWNFNSNGRTRPVSDDPECRSSPLFTCVKLALPPIWG